MWYWYISGWISAFLLVSALINVGFVYGFITYTKSKKSTQLTNADKALYDWAKQDITWDLIPSSPGTEAYEPNRKIDIDTDMPGQWSSYNHSKE